MQIHLSSVFSNNTTYVLLSLILAFAVAISCANVWEYLSLRKRHGQYAWRSALADWSIVLGLIALVVREAHSEAGLPLNAGLALGLSFCRCSCSFGRLI